MAATSVANTIAARAPDGNVSIVIIVCASSPMMKTMEGGRFLARAIRRANAGIEYKWLVLHRVMLGEAAEEEICCAQD